MITFETHEDFEAAVKHYIEANLKVHGHIGGSFGKGSNVLVDVYFTLEDKDNVFIST